MNNRYLSISGDMWDVIALKTMGSEMHKDKLMNANRQFRTIFIFPAGIELVIPDVPVETAAGLPPWRRG